MQETNHKNITGIFEDYGNLNGHLHILTEKIIHGSISWTL